LEKAGVGYLLSSWIDIFSSSKTKSVPEFGNLCGRKGPRALPPISAKHLFGDTMHEFYTIHKQDEGDRSTSRSPSDERREHLRRFLSGRTQASIMALPQENSATSRMPKLSVRDVGKRYDLGDGTTIEAVRDVSFDVQEGEICALLGTSGCGKSTVLRLVAGAFRQPRGNDEG
jgi:ABC-type glutathione transport system ATPase component